MKTLIAILLITTATFSQGSPYVAISADLRNGILGSNPTQNKPEADLLFRAGMVSNKGLKIGALYETFPAIDFQKYGFEIGQQIKITNKIIAIPTIEATIIIRESLNFLNAGVNGELIYMLTKNLGISAIANYSTATDLIYYYDSKRFRFSGYIGFVWRFDPYTN
jgi:hypothetical protein